MRNFLYKLLVHIQIFFLKLNYYKDKNSGSNKSKDLKIKLEKLNNFNIANVDIKAINLDEFFSHSSVDNVTNKSYYYLFALPYDVLFNSIYNAKEGEDLNSYFFFNEVRNFIIKFNLELINQCIKNIDTFDHDDINKFLNLSFNLISHFQLSSDKYSFSKKELHKIVKKRETDIYFEQANLLFSQKGLSPKDGFSDKAYYACRCANDLNIAHNYYTLPTLLSWEIKYNKDVIKPLNARYNDLSNLIKFVTDNNSSCKVDIIRQYENEMLSLNREISNISKLIDNSEALLQNLNGQAA